jgi:hypothetical protein
MKWIFIMATVLVLLASAIHAQAAANAACPAPRGAVSVVIPSGLPTALRAAMGNVALPGEPFDTTDVYVKGHKRSRYMFVWNIGNRWIVATEVGGIALRAAISTYDLGTDNKTATLIESSTTSPAYACAAATRLAGK